MANATTLTVTKLTANGYKARATANLLDTGTATVTLNATLTGPYEQFFIEVYNSGSATLTAWLSAGVNPPSWGAEAGAVLSIPAAETGYLCVLEAMKYLHTGNHFEINFVSAATLGASIYCMEIPKG
ncbi:MAG: hypothetical protein WCP58_09595 [bacterium]